jgi:hypothetical protein
MIVPTSDLFKLAYDKHAIGAYNINNLEQMEENNQGHDEVLPISHA